MPRSMLQDTLMLVLEFHLVYDGVLFAATADITLAGL